MFELSLILLIPFAILISYYDIKFGKIKNMHILILIIFGILINLFYNKTLLTSTKEVMLNVAISFLIGYFLWNLGVWSAADAKLFSALSIFVPINIYKIGAIKYFPSYIILVNTFVPVAILFFVYGLFKLKFDFLKREVIESFKWKSISLMLVFIIGFSSFFTFLQNFFQIRINLLFQLILIIVLLELGSNFNEILKVFSITSFILAVLFTPKFVFNLVFIGNIILFFLIFQMLRISLSYLNEFLLSRKVKIDDLKEGMVLNEIILKKGEKYKKEKVLFITYFDILGYSKKIGKSAFSGRLMDNDVKRLISLKKEKKLDFNDVMVSKPIPFAPFIFLGVFLVYILDGSIVFYLISFKNHIWMYLKVIFYEIYGKLR
ncbi:MAG: A24 family peptidase C-terminal domain-containing protein [Candidatus Aenigmatarchaeota archaeon]